MRHEGGITQFLSGGEGLILWPNQNEVIMASYRAEGPACDKPVPKVERLSRVQPSRRDANHDLKQAPLETGGPPST